MSTNHLLLLRECCKKPLYPADDIDWGQRVDVWRSQVFYRTHIIAFVAFMVFGFIHHYQLWAYTMPGEASASEALCLAHLSFEMHGERSKCYCGCYESNRLLRQIN